MEYVWLLIYFILYFISEIVIGLYIPMVLGEQVGLLILKRWFPSWTDFRSIVYEWILGIFKYRNWLNSLVGFVSFILLMVLIVIMDHAVFDVLGVVPRIEVLVPLQMLSIHLHNQRLRINIILLAFITGFVTTLFMNWYYMQRRTQPDTEMR